MADKIYIQHIYSRAFIAMQNYLQTQIFIKIATKSNARVWQNPKGTKFAQYYIGMGDRRQRRSRGGRKEVDYADIYRVRWRWVLITCYQKIANAIQMRRLICKWHWNYILTIYDSFFMILDGISANLLIWYFFGQFYTVKRPFLAPPWLGA